jgi:hypothetical protein
MSIGKETPRDARDIELDKIWAAVSAEQTTQTRFAQNLLDAIDSAATSVIEVDDLQDYFGPGTLPSDINDQESSRPSNVFNLSTFRERRHT